MILVANNLSCNLILGMSFMQKSKLILDIYSQSCSFQFAPSVNIKLSQTAGKDLVSHMNVNNVYTGLSEMQTELDKLLKRFSNVLWVQ